MPVQATNLVPNLLRGEFSSVFLRISRASAVAAFVLKFPLVVRWRCAASSEEQRAAFGVACFDVQRRVPGGTGVRSVR